MLLQFGMGVGNVQSCIDLCRDVEPLLGHVNGYLDDRPDELQEQLDDAVDACLAWPKTRSRPRTNSSARSCSCGLPPVNWRCAPRSRQCCTRAPRAIFRTAPAQRKLRESYFIAIVTPAIKQLRKELDVLSQAA